MPSAGNVPVGGVDVRPVSGSGAVQSIRSYSGSLTYHFGSREGSAVASLQIARPGRFLVRATSSAAPPGSHLAIGSSIAGGIAVIVFPALGLVLAAISGAIAVAVTRHNRPGVPACHRYWADRLADRPRASDQAAAS